MAKRFLLVTEEWAGSGHRMAAEALQEVLLESEGARSARVVGGLKTASPGLRVLSHFFYRNMLRYGQPVWQRIYEQDEMLSSALSKALGWWLSARLSNQLLQEEKPDVVIATHAYCLSALAEAKRRVSKPFQLVCVPTDFHINRFWVHPEIDAYMVAHEQIAQNLIEHYGIAPEKIHVYGIPVRPAFTTALNTGKAAWKKQLGLVPDQFTVLIGGGEGGYGGVEQVVRELLLEEQPLQIVVVTGKNTSLYRRLTGLLGTEITDHRFILKGFEPQMWQWIGAADAYITKPGGISCAESLALKTPLILFHPLPGQEKHNCSFLLEQQAAILAETPVEIKEIIRLWRQPEKRDAFVGGLDKLGRPEAAHRIAHVLLQLTD
ncbi:glycosyltransferase [Brevibacillus sp. BC25]|uniref:MGDG synthase family glycosyltransferase n=1 Tax=Brevibacillus sp. BC25 TaxID=1144308 RepID=UPI000270F439|nr:glycosyltransferase [Brevibacillus sp. BC25]EJL31704.1 UDP-N-acetylglucosamine:LPS N-acetylglucosamine transferase [Brevibacillus sp. BC25]